MNSPNPANAGRPRISVIIVNYNSGGYVVSCIESVQKHLSAIRHEIIVVDNASTDDGPDVIASLFPDVRQVLNGKNLGFAAGTNIGIREAKGDYLLFLNPDTELMDDAMPAMLDFMAANPDVGILGCQNVRPDGSIQPSAYRFPSVAMQLAYIFRLKNILTHPIMKKLLGRFLAESYGQYDPHQKIRDADYVTGAFMLVRREAAEKTGPMDENYFLFYEEIDWCKGMKSAGYRVVFHPGCTVLHHIGISSRGEKPVVLLARHDSMLHYFRKHGTAVSFSIVRWGAMAGALLWMTAGNLGALFGTLEENRLAARLEAEKYSRLFRRLLSGDKSPVAG